MQPTRDFYYCSICGNLIGVINNGGGELVCCGQPMTLLKANSTEAATEKHVPVGTRAGSSLHVAVGSVPHPMTDAHYIQWICVAQGNRTQRVSLSPGQEPAADFAIDNGPLVIYAYCNLHGLWKADLE